MEKYRYEYKVEIDLNNITEAGRILKEANEIVNDMTGEQLNYRLVTEPQTILYMTLSTKLNNDQIIEVKQIIDNKLMQAFEGNDIPIINTFLSYVPT